MARSLRSDTGTPSPPAAGHVRVLASATLADTEHRFDLLHYLGLLRRLEKVVCLRLTRHRRHPGHMSTGSSFLEVVLKLPRFQHWSNHDFMIDDVLAGKEWRRKPDKLQSRRSGEGALGGWGRLDIDDLGAVPLHNWGPWASAHAASPQGLLHAQDSQHFLLIAHPWGHDRLQLVEIPEHIVEKGETPAPPAPQLSQCSLCKSAIQPLEAVNTLCVFHPGMMKARDFEGSSSSGSESASDEEDSEWDDFVWTCCDGERHAPGCMVETHHLTADEVRPALDGHRWASVTCSDELRDVLTIGS